MWGELPDWVERLLEIGVAIDSAIEEAIYGLIRWLFYLACMLFALGCVALFVYSFVR